MMTYEQVSKLPRSEKIILITCEAAQLAKLFYAYDTFVWVRDVPYFVSGIKIGAPGREEQAESIEDLGSTKPWFYDIQNKKLYIFSPFDPKTLNITIIYKFFFSNTPLNLSYDLADGEDLEWLSYVKSIGPIGQQLDDENTGVVLESNSQIDFINNDGFFDPIFDTLIWENQSVDFYSWFGGLNKSEIRKIFSGVVESKDYQVNNVRFKVKDFVYKLKNKINLPLFTESDGSVPDSLINTPKKLIYGKADKVKCYPIDAIKEGFELTGTISLTSGTKNINGTGTQFNIELSPSDKIKVLINDEEIELTIDTVESSTLATIANELEISGSNLTALCLPDRPFRLKNRRWHIAGHPIRESETSITNVINSTTIIVNDASEFFKNDIVEINNVFIKILRISGNYIFLSQSINPPSIGDLIKRSAVTNAYFGKNKLLPGRDFTLDITNESVLVLDDSAEFNIAPEVLSTVSFDFFISSDTINMTTLNADLRTIIKPRDWIRSADLADWYEVLSVTENSLKIRTPYLSPTQLGKKAIIKNTELVNDDSLILVDCYGKSSFNKWVKTASDVVKDLLVGADIDPLNDDSFDQARIDCNYIISMVLPETSESPLIRDVITKINESVFGSLYSNPDQEICFSILNTRKQEEIFPIKDDDVISWSVSSSQKIINNVKINYSTFIDNVTGDNSFKSVEFTSSFVNQNLGLKNTIERYCYLYNESDALIVAQRISFFNSLSLSIINLRAKANFMTSSVNDRVYLELDRIYTRYGGSNRGKIGIISGIKKNTFDTEITINDLGNIFNRSMGIAPSDSSIFTLASGDEKIKFGYIVDNETLTPDPSSEEGLGSNLIG